MSEKSAIILLLFFVALVWAADQKCPGVNNPKDFNELTRVASDYLQKKEYANARACLTAAHKLQPNVPQTLCNLGQLASTQQDWDATITYFKKCLAGGFKHAQAYFDLGNAYMAKGQHAEALKNFEESTKLDPKNANSVYRAGVAAKQLGEAAKSLKLFQRAVKLDPSNFGAHTSIANHYEERGDNHKAIAAYRRALELKPDCAECHFNMGLLCQRISDSDCQFNHIKRATELSNTLSQAHMSLASIYQQQGAVDKAVETHQRYITANSPQSFVAAINGKSKVPKKISKQDQAAYAHLADTLYSLGSLQLDLARMPQAITSLSLALLLDPTHGYYHNNLGIAYQRLNRLEDALKAYQNAVKYMPTLVHAHTNIGNILKSLGRPEEAVSAFEHALSIDPSFAEAYNNLAGLYSDHGMVHQAIGTYKQALAANPRIPSPLTNLVNALHRVSDWRDRDSLLWSLQDVTAEELKNGSVSGGGVVVPAARPLHILNYPVDQNLIKAVSQAYALDYGKTSEHYGVDSWSSPQAKEAAHKRVTKRKGVLNVGYVSSDFLRHPVSYAVSHMFGFHNRSRVHPHCYATKADDAGGSVFRKTIRQGSHKFHEVESWSTPDLRGLVRDQDSIDILVDLNGFTEGARHDLFELQPAPIQIGYLGYCGTSGSSHIQYAAVDRTIIPPQQSKFYTEKMLYLPESYMITDHKQTSPEALKFYRILKTSSLENMNSSSSGEESSPMKTVVAVTNGEKTFSREDFGLPSDSFVFANFNQHYKIDPVIFDVWMNVMRKVPNSVLWLLRFNPNGEDYFKEEAKNRGISPDRIIVTDLLPLEDHLSIKSLADLFLDTLYYNAHITGSDALWAGIPVLTLPGDKFASRVGSSLQESLGCRSLITGNLLEYELMAIHLSTNQTALDSVRKCVEERREVAPLFDTQGWVAKFEKGLKLVWNAYVFEKDTFHVIVK